jgi:hypothetical protein
MQVDAKRDQARADGIARLHNNLERRLGWEAEKRHQRSVPNRNPFADFGNAIAMKDLPIRSQSALQEAVEDQIAAPLKSQARQVGWTLCGADQGQIGLMPEVARYDDVAPRFSSWLDHRWIGLEGAWWA